MQEIADASGLGRTTVYRHFPTRQDLFEAMFESAILKARVEVTARAFTRTGTAEQVLHRLSEVLIDFGAEFRFLASNQGYGKRAMQQGREASSSPIRNWLREAQDQGELRTDLPLQWMASLVQALALVAMEDQMAGHYDADEAKRLLAGTMADALLPT